MTVKYIDQIDITDKRVIIRVDYNVPYDNDMNITDDTRIKSTIPTLNYCLERGCTLVLVSHLGRPRGQVVANKSLKPVAERLSQLLDKSVQFIEDELGEPALAAVNKLQKGEIALLENVRFYPGENKNDQELGKKISILGDVFINDAFATAHRAHSSNFAVTDHMDLCAAGFLLKNEIEFFNKALQSPERPVTAIIGGIKVSTKIDALVNIIPKIDFLLIGGGMANTFIKAQGYNVGTSVCEDDYINTAIDIIAEAEKFNTEIILPSDLVVAKAFNDDSVVETCTIDSIPENMAGVDMGEKTIEKFIEIIRKSKTVIWNGPVGAFETNAFSRGTFKLAEALANSDCLSLIGGGDTAAAVNLSGFGDKMSYISTGGGAFLELLEEKELPGIAALDK